MKIQGLKNLNITLLFSTPLNHLLISPKEVVELFKTGDAQKDLVNFIEAPGFKAVIFPNQKKDVAFENSRVSLSDKTEDEINKSTIVPDLRKILNGNFFGQSKIIAYGFNYDFLVELDNGNDLIGAKILKIPDLVIKSAGVNFSFEGKNGVTNVLSATPTGKEKQFLVHLNSHFNATDIPEDKVLDKQIAEQFTELERILNNL